MDTTSNEGQDVPRFALEIVPHAANSTFLTTAIISFLATLRRLPDPTGKSCIVGWNAPQHCFFTSPPELFHESETGSVQLEIRTLPHESSGSEPNTKGSVQITNASYYSHHLQEISSDGCLVALVTLPPNYQQQLIPGERYHLKWPTSEIEYWTWGSLADKMGSDIEYHDPGGASSAIVLPPASVVNFAMEEASHSWPYRDKVESKLGYLRANLEETVWRQENEQQRLRNTRAEKSYQEQQKQLVSSPGAPVLKTTLECSPILYLDEPFRVTARIELENTGPDSRPITFHTFNVDTVCFWLFRKRKPKALQARNSDDEYRLDELEWEYCEPESDCGGYLIVDDPDVTVKVGDRRKFISLQPGEIWECSYLVEVDDWTYPTEDTTAGDVFRIWYAGGELDWWDWGDDTQHANTEVVLPCFLNGAVIEPRDNNSRPKARVMASDSLDFVVQDSRDQLVHPSG